MVDINLPLVYSVCAPGEAQKEISMHLGRGGFGEDETIQLSQQRPNRLLKVAWSPISLTFEMWAAGGFKGA